MTTLVTTLIRSIPQRFAGIPLATRLRIWLILALMTGLFLRIHCLLFPYLWLDEYVTLWSISGDTYGEMFRRSTEWTASGPLFVLCYRLSCELTSSVEWGLKAPGVVAGTLAIWLAWWSSQRVFERSDVSLAAAWMVALAPQFIHFSQEARPYMIASVLLLGAIGFLAAWLRSGRSMDLAAVAALSLLAIGFQLLCALSLVAQNLIVFGTGLCRGWTKRRWLEWCVAQASIVTLIWLCAGQLRMLSSRHGTMLFETALPMPTRLSLNDGLRGQVQGHLAILFVGVIFWYVARKFPKSPLANAWRTNGGAVCLAAGTYWVPAVAITLLSAARFLDPWPRYYFLFQSGSILAMVCLVMGAFPKPLSRVLIAVIIAGSITQFNFVNGLLSCRLNDAWKEFGDAERMMHQRFGPDDLVLSRSGLIESNHLRFLMDPVGASYLKSFCEARSGPLEADHIPLPFSPESLETRMYARQVLDRACARGDFWVANIGVSDFDYNAWIAKEYGGTICRQEQIVYPMITLTRFVHEAVAQHGTVSTNPGQKVR